MTNPNPTLDAQARQLLRDTAEFFETHELCRDVFARDSVGNGIRWDELDACAWCVRGALMKLLADRGESLDGMLSIESRLMLHHMVVLPSGCMSIHHWSDSNPKDVIIAGLRAAAESGEA
jgi:hypothetical protein